MTGFLEKKKKNDVIVFSSRLKHVSLFFLFFFPVMVTFFPVDVTVFIG